MDPSLDPDRFNTAEPTGDAEEALAATEVAPRPAATAIPRRASGGKWRASRDPVPELAGVVR